MTKEGKKALQWISNAYIGSIETPPAGECESFSLFLIYFSAMNLHPQETINPVNRKFKNINFIDRIK